MGTSRFCMMNFIIGLFPSNVGVHETFTDLGMRDTRTDLTPDGAYGSSITSRCAERVSFPPDDIT